MKRKNDVVMVDGICPYCFSHVTKKAKEDCPICGNYSETLIGMRKAYLKEAVAV